MVFDYDSADANVMPETYITKTWSVVIITDHIVVLIIMINNTICTAVLVELPVDKHRGERNTTAA